MTRLVDKTRRTASSGDPVEPSSADQIARIAARLFAAKGYDATPVRAIVEAAGVTKPTLYYHFGSKAGLAKAVLTDPLNRLLAAMRLALESNLDPVRAAEELFELNLAFSRDEPDRARFLYALFFGPLGSGLAEEVKRICDGFDALWAELADRLIEANLLDSSRIEGFLAMSRGAIVVRTVDFLYCGQDLETDRAGRIVKDLLDGFGVGPRQSTKMGKKS
jgi:TetR/AcrR family transcriptional regulator